MRDGGSSDDRGNLETGGGKPGSESDVDRKRELQSGHKAGYWIPLNGPNIFLCMMQ